MKKLLKKPLIIIGILFVTYTVFGQTDILTIYNIPTIANEPALMLNSIIFVSNLADHENGDFVCYKYENEMMGEHIRVHRLLGKSADIVEIKNGILYLNDKNVDENIDLKHLYIINPSEFQSLLDKKLVRQKDMMFKRDEEVYVFLIDGIAEQNRLSSKMKLEPENESDKIIEETYNQKWNQDNFGPLKIPNGQCFVIGDNRHNSEDSRYIGLINESDIVGTVVKK